MTINHRRSQRCSCNVPFPCPEKSKVEGRRSTSKPLFAHQGEQLYLYLRVFGFEFRLLCRVAQPLKLWLGRVSVRTSEEGVRVRAARKLLKKQKPKCESNHYVHLSRPENCSECRCWLVVWVPCHFLPYPPHGAYTRMYIVRLSVSQSASWYVSQSVRTFRRPKGIIICQLAIVCYPHSAKQPTFVAAEGW